MIAANPLPSSESAADKKPYEPSMEEILASIRRIIADDQSLPGRGSPQASAPTLAPMARDLRRSIPPSPAVEPTSPPVQILAVGDEGPLGHHGEPVASHEQATVTPPGPRLDSGLAHGSIAAPQFATPEGPIADVQAREPQTPTEQPPPAPDLAAAPPTLSHDAASGQVRSQPQSLQDEPLYDAPIDPVPARQIPSERPELFSAATDSAVSAAFNMLAASRLADNSDELMTLAREMIRPLLRSWIDDNLPSMVERMVRAEIERVARGGR